MILTDLRITLMAYGPNKGCHVGTATFSDDTGEVKLTLNHHHIDEIFRTCADSIVDVAKAAARHLTARVIEQKDAPRIEGRSGKDGA